MQKITKRNVVLAILFLFILVVVALLIGNFTFSYLGADISDDVNTRGETTVSGDTIIFSKGNDLSLQATTDNFNATSGNLTATTNPSARLIASGKTNSATSTYYVGIKIYDNTYNYSNGTNAEVILTVRDDTGAVVNASDDTSLSYVTVTDASGSEISGFDITGKIGAFNIFREYPISTTSSTSGTTQTWTFTLTFVNYNYDQSANENANIDMEVVLQKDEIEITLAELCSNKTLADCIITRAYENDGINSLYYHDGVGLYGNQEAGDNSYRYVGANPNNYVCFGSDAASCPADNLYRIVGVFDENKDGLYKVKLIKADYVNEEILGSDGRDYFGLYISFWGQSGIYKGNMLQENISAYRWNNDTSSSDIGVNNWTTSELNVLNLNTNFITYLNNIDTKWENLIDVVTWHLGGNDSDDGTAKSFYINERSNSGFENNPTTYESKIGLVYPSDYGYASTPENWINNLHSFSSANNTNNNWMYLGLFEWTITPITSSGSNIFYIHSDGGISNGYASNVFAVRPVFYLNPDVKIIGGNGSIDDPIRVS